MTAVVAAADLRGFQPDGTWVMRQVVSLRYPATGLWSTLLPQMQQQTHVDLAEHGLEADDTQPALATCETVTDPDDPTVAPHRIVTLVTVTRRCRC